MSNGLITGLVKSVRESSFMLDDGRWYGIHPDSGLTTPDVGSFVVVQYWTKSSKYNGSWRTFHNVQDIKQATGRVKLAKTNEQFNGLAQAFHFHLEAQAPSDNFDDDIPF